MAVVIMQGDLLTLDEAAVIVDFSYSKLMSIPQSPDCYVIPNKSTVKLAF